jgi:hypothetical protein
MNEIVVAVIIGVLLIAGIIRWLWIRKLKNKIYIGQRLLLTPAEQNLVSYLFSVLELFPHTHLLCKVRIADIVELNPTLDGKRYAKGLSAIAAKHVDYCVVDRRTWEPIVVLELDDKSHDRLDRQQRDAFVDQVFAEVNLPIIHVKAKARYSVKEIKLALLPLLKESLKNQEL